MDQLLAGSADLREWDGNLGVVGIGISRGKRQVLGTRSYARSGRERRVFATRSVANERGTASQRELGGEERARH